jgi:hypothetical protein
MRQGKYRKEGETDVTGYHGVTGELRMRSIYSSKY